MKKFRSIHGLKFLSAQWINPEFCKFKIGSCEGLWGVTLDYYSILGIENKTNGNGHLEDVFQWFEMSAKRDKRNLVILEVWNGRFKKHLITKRGFVIIPGTEHVIKVLVPLKTHLENYIWK